MLEITADVSGSLWCVLGIVHKKIASIRNGLDSWEGGCKVTQYEITEMFGFVIDFNELFLDDQKELWKNKIYRSYLLLVKMRFPGSFVV